MLIIANGAFKSGSTWQFNILKQMTGFAPVPETYRGEWVNPTLEAENFAKFLQEVDLSVEKFISKNHIGDRTMRDLIFANSNIYVFNIERDMRDVLVSAYYHNTRKKSEKPDFASFYYERGRDIALRVMNYHRMWAAPESPRYFLSSYEGLHQDFRGEVLKMATFLGLSLDDAALGAIEAATTIEKLREDYGEENRDEAKRFFRKGEMGDWQNHFDETMLKDLAKLQADFANKSTFIKRLQRRVTKLWRAK